ncbi:MAG: adenylyl-sulfate kinase [Pseudomonadales bacterium]|nr:adenylyl-sulfate kinase [Pseudomonadales bacterium]
MGTSYRNKSIPLVWQTATISPEMRAEQKQQQMKCIWFTGLSGAGKSTLADALDKALYASNRHTFLLDGDNVRHGLCRDLTMSEADRSENIRRVAEVARLMAEAGLIVIAAFISPFKADRDLARSLFKPGEFYEIYVNTPLAVCENRDPKGLYKKARDGVISDFTGISSPYEEPGAEALWVDTSNAGIDELLEKIIDYCFGAPLDRAAVDAATLSRQDQ